MIFRKHTRETYFSIANAAVRDPNLSFRATGILAFLLSNAETWTPQGGHLAEQKKEGRVAVENALRELEAAGYVVRRWVRDKETGAFVWEAHVYEEPVPVEERSSFEDRKVNARKGAHLDLVTILDESSEVTSAVIGSADMRKPATKKDQEREIPSKKTSSATPDPQSLAIVPMQPAVARRNELWDALEQVCGKATTRNEQARRGRVVKDLKDVGATGDEVCRRAVTYRLMWPGASLTDTALVNHWSKCAEDAPQRVESVDVKNARIIANLQAQQARGGF